ncbi:hypothetical protein JOM56_000035 [Amanita muscaria]
MCQWAPVAQCSISGKKKGNNFTTVNANRRVHAVNCFQIDKFTPIRIIFSPYPWAMGALRASPLRHNSMYNMPLLYTSMDLNSAPDVGLPSYHGNLASKSDHIQDWVSTGFYLAVSGNRVNASPARFHNFYLRSWANIDAKLRELEDLYRKHQDALARLRANISFNATTPFVPISTTSPYSTTDISPHSFIQGEMGNVHMQTSSTSSSIAPHAQLATHSPPEYPVCMDETSQTILHRETLGHVKKPYTCHCGKGYSRKDSLLRHAAIHTSERTRTSEVALSGS